MPPTQKIGRGLARIDQRPSGGSLDDPITIEDGKTIRIDYAKLETPGNVYDADYAWITHRAGSTSLFFGKLNHDSPGSLRTRLEVRYPIEAFLRHFWANSRTFHQKLKEFAADWPIDPERAATDPRGFKAEKEHSEWANFEYVAHSGSEAGIDFFRLPPAGIAQFAKGQGTSGLKCSSVVRVHLTSFELLQLLDQVDAAADAVRGYLPAAVAAAIEKERTP